jgi:hypothetical protein
VTGGAVLDGAAEGIEINELLVVVGFVADNPNEKPAGAVAAGAGCPTEVVVPARFPKLKLILTVI